MEHQFLVMWDCNGLECVADYTEYSQKKVWQELQGAKPGDTDFRPVALFPNIEHLKLRARYNSQRNYEIYAITAVDGITEQDIRDMFEANPQGAADTIRRLGQVLYSDRMVTERKIV